MKKYRHVHAHLAATYLQGAVRPRGASPRLYPIDVVSRCFRHGNTDKNDGSTQTPNFAPTIIWTTGLVQNGGSTPMNAEMSRPVGNVMLIEAGRAKRQSALKNCAAGRLTNEGFFDQTLMSAFGGKADVIQGVAKCPLIAKSGHLSDGCGGKSI